MLIQAIGTFTVGGLGLKVDPMFVAGEFAEIEDGAAQFAIEQGTARKATMAEYLATLAPKDSSTDESTATEEAAIAAPRRGNKRFNSAAKEG